LTTFTAANFTFVHKVLRKVARLQLRQLKVVRFADRAKKCWCDDCRLTCQCFTGNFGNVFQIRFQQFTFPLFQEDGHSGCCFANRKGQLSNICAAGMTRLPRKPGSAVCWSSTAKPLPL